MSPHIDKPMLEAVVVSFMFKGPLFLPQYICICLEAAEDHWSKSYVASSDPVLDVEFLPVRKEKNPAHLQSIPVRVRVESGCDALAKNTRRLCLERRVQPHLTVLLDRLNSNLDIGQAPSSLPHFWLNASQTYVRRRVFRAVQLD